MQHVVADDVLVWRRGEGTFDTETGGARSEIQERHERIINAR